MSESTSCTLEVVKGVRVGEVFTFSQDLVRVGRSAENDLVVNDSSVSRRHAEIVRDPRANRWTIRDLDSQNGILVNGAKVAEQALSNEDRVVVGEHEFRFGCAAAPAEKTGRTVVVPAAGSARPGAAEPAPKAKEAAPKPGRGRRGFRSPLVLGAAGFVFLLLIAAVGLSLKSGGPKGPSLPPQSKEPIPLPASGAFGLIPFKGMDKSHADRVDFTFVARSKKLELVYSTAGVAAPGDVVVYLNGFRIGEADIKTEWTFPKAVSLPPEYVVLNGTNTLTFDNTHNPPGAAPWGVRQVSVTDWGAEACDAAKGMEAFNLGKSKAETKLVAPDNLVRGYDALRRSMRLWEQCAPRPPEYGRAEEMTAALKQEIDEKVRRMLLETETATRMEQYRGALQTLAELRKMFYDPADPRLTYVNEKGERTAGLMQTKGKGKGKG